MSSIKQTLTPIVVLNCEYSFSQSYDEITSKQTTCKCLQKIAGRRLKEQDVVLQFFQDSCRPGSHS